MRGPVVVDLTAPELRRAVPDLLASPEPWIVADEVVDRRAAVTLVLSPSPELSAVTEALLVLRAAIEARRSSQRTRQLSSKRRRASASRGPTSLDDWTTSIPEANTCRPSR